MPYLSLNRMGEHRQSARKAPDNRSGTQNGERNMATDKQTTEERDGTGFMTDSAIEAEAHALIDLGIKMKPEGEGIDLTDREYQLPDIIRIKRMLSTMRSTIDMLTPALAAYWESEYPGISTDLDDEHWWLSANKKWKLREDKAEDFAEWLTKQDPELVSRIVPPRGLRTSPMAQSVKDTFMTNEITKEDLRIQRKPKY